MDVDLELRAWGATQNGSFRAAFLDTLQLADLVDESGTPLEQLGYTITFDAGITLPSADPVPEPASLALFGFGAVGLAAHRRRKRRKA